MNYTEQFIKQGKFSQNDIFIKDCLLLETILGSHAYGCAGENSDYDISAIFMDRHQDLYPQQYGHILGFNNLSRFESKEIKGAGKRIVLDNGRECEGEWHSLTNFFFLTGVKGSPPLVETLFTRRNWVTIGSDIGWMLRDNRKLFLSAKTFHSFRGYSFGQLSRIRNGHVSGKSDNSTRQVYIDKFGYDCYSEETEFLTQKGWKLYNEISSDDLLATVDQESLSIQFQKYSDRVKYPFKGNLYAVENNFTRFEITPNHNLFTSRCIRGKDGAAGYSYDADKANWKLEPIESIDKKSRSWYHVLNFGINSNVDFDVTDHYLQLSGLYVSEGSTQFGHTKKNGKKPKSIRISQTLEGKMGVFTLMRAMPSDYKVSEHNSNHITSASKNVVSETLWIIYNKEITENIYKDFGHAKNKHYPEWIFKLSKRQAEIFLNAMLLGDGTYIDKYDQHIYYSSVKSVADLAQILSLLSGKSSNIMGPYQAVTSFGLCNMYQVLISKTLRPMPICINSTCKTHPHTKLQEYSGNVVCFKVPNETLITRLGGKTSVQGNCKMAYHLLRLLDELEQILTIQDIDLMRAKDACIAMRKGEWGVFEQLETYFNQKLATLEEIMLKGTLPLQPQVGALQKLLAECIEQYYGSMSKANVEYVSAKDVMEKLSAIENLINRKADV